MGGEDSAVGFGLTSEGASIRGPKHFSLVPGSKKAIRIGRAPTNDIQVELRGCSQYHAEIRLLEAEDEDSQPRLVVRDLSMNGTGLKKWEDKDPAQTKKDEDEKVYHGTQILVPFQLKANQAPEDRAWLKVVFDEPEGQEPPEEEEAANGDEKKEKRKKEDDDEDEKSDDEEEGEDDDDEDANEKSRMQFVDLLMKTRDISAGTTYEDAEELLSKKSQWKAVDEQTRKECFEIFVEHLGSAGKKKKKDKKNKKRKRKEEDEEEEEEEEEASEDRPKKSKKKKSKKEKKRSESS